MNISSMDTGTSFLVEDMKPVRRGALPFKKRRFPHLHLLSGLSKGNPDEESSLSLKLSSTSSESVQGVSSDAEQIAALSLLAAAASGNPSDSQAVELSSRQEVESVTSVEEPKRHGFSISLKDSESADSDRTLSGALVAAAADLRSLQHSSSPVTSTADDAGTAPASKSNRAPLRSPLPNGCHGRTSRNNSYCRRHPCYNGSKYCKLHYQHYVVAGAASDQELMSGVVVEAPDTILEGGTDGAPASAGSVDGNAKAAVGGSQVVHHQDKRYTGCAEETRCKATTTRGRDCAYCAVKGTKYCYLHADYDTNPPPRRGGTGVSANTAAGKAKEGAVGLEAGGKPGLSETTSGNAKTAKGKAEASKRKSPSTSARRLSASKNIEKHMADAPYPLLSTLATDKWLRRKVIVSTGPLTNHVGLVEKWGNGWVSVRLPGVGLHNRRSFELYLHPNPESNGDSSNSVGAQNNPDKTVPLVEVFDTSSEGKSSVEDEGASRSEETGTPPTPMIANKPMMNCGQVHEVTPLISCRVIGIENAGDGGSKKVSNIMFPTCMNSLSPTTVPESPVPVQQDAPPSLPTENEKTVGTTASSLQQNGSDVLQSKLMKPPIKSTMESESGDIPLVRSLLLAQQDRAAKHKLGLLFGTAALERSRRSIHKPVRYVDTELMGKKLKKRVSDAIDGASLDGSAKRVCTEESQRTSASVTPASSSSDEESSEAPVSMVSV